MEHPLEEEQTGGRMLASGVYGCVFIPPLRCEGETRPPPHQGKTIDKLMTEAHAVIEFAVAERIRQIPLWKNYFIVSESMCTPAPKNKQVETDLDECKVVDPEHLKRMRLIRMTYGGTPLPSYRMNFQSHSFYDFVIHMIESVALLNLSRVAHMDLHMGNILVDKANTPRLIDFNLSIDLKADQNLKKRLSHMYSPTYTQESPDNAILIGAQRKMNGMVVINDIMRFKAILVTIRSVLGVSEKEQRDSMVTFYKTSPSAQSGDLVRWFRLYWRVCDSWAIGCVIVWLISRLSLWQSFVEGPYATYQASLIKVLRKMCDTNPKERIDAVQALNMLDPSNFIVRTYGKEWLAVVNKHGTV